MGENVMKVLVTGGAGYIGSILVKELIARGYKVRVMDIFNFGFESLISVVPSAFFEMIPGDIRKPEYVDKALDGVDAVIHLAAIVGDPACTVNANVAIETNYLATLRIAMAARDKGINKFIFASTCSVYGAGQLELDEESELNPVSLYAETKILAEKGLMNLQTNEFRPVILRLGTLYGLSPRMRFDLVVNYLTAKLTEEGKCKIFGGEQWRPFLHVEDAAKAFIFALNNYDDMNGEVYNVGENWCNYQLKDIGALFSMVFPDEEIEYISEVKDHRSYNVEFGKITDLGYRLTREVVESIIEMRKYIEDNKIDSSDDKYYNYHP
jgi:nucleoside-diphosphate-sugar epimerase